jgi:two-component system alkaline phosphatase synthesis response regulator PhoP
MNHKILVIEDDANVADMLQRWLQELKFSVLTASDGPEGLELFQHYRPELVLLDIAMPIMNGFEVASAIRQMETLEGERRHTPIIVLSAYTQSYFVSVGSEVGIDSYLTKPVGLDQLASHISGFFATAV